jgi:alkyl sulfatase BDS1-like metallo-beta-lactamase superfamily hydrolase
MGGAAAVLSRARKDYDAGNYRWVAEAVNHVVFADPTNQEAKNLEADALEQLGYQAESGPWRNFYLTGAKELRDGVTKLPTPNTASPDTIRAMSLDLFFDYLGMKLNGPKADGKRIVLNFDFTDVKEKYMIEMVHGVLNHTPNRQAKEADATITLTRETLNGIVLGQTAMKDAISSGTVKIDGSQAKLDEMLSYLDTFEFWFDIVTP